MQTPTRWKRRSSEYLFQSRWYSLRQDALTLPDGEEITYILVEHPAYKIFCISPATA
jgi:hypothetical protein